VARWPTVSSR